MMNSTHVPALRAVVSLLSLSMMIAANSVYGQEVWPNLYASSDVSVYPSLDIAADMTQVQAGQVVTFDLSLGDAQTPV